MTAPLSRILIAHIALIFFCFFFNDTATTEIYTLSLHDALPIWLPLPTQLNRAARIVSEWQNLANQLFVIASHRASPRRCSRCGRGFDALKGAARWHGQAIRALRFDCPVRRLCGESTPPRP